MSYEATLEAKRKKKKTNVSLNWYRSVWEIRADSWIQLNDDLGRMVQIEAGTSEYKRRHARVSEILDRLEPIESYWAFPGRHLFDHLRTFFEANDITRLHGAVRRINRALAEHTYRHQQVDATDEAEPNREVEHTVEHLAQIQRPYFEVLVVDELTQAEEGALRRRICEMRRPDDHFVYDVVVVPSFEDALIAALFNFNIQACIIRHGFPFKSEYSLDLLRGFLEGVEEARIEGLLESERGPLLGRKIAELRPELDL